MEGSCWQGTTRAPSARRLLSQQYCRTHQQSRTLLRRLKISIRPLCLRIRHPANRQGPPVPCAIPAVVPKRHFCPQHVTGHSPSSISKWSRGDGGHVQRLMPGPVCLRLHLLIWPPASTQFLVPFCMSPFFGYVTIALFSPLPSTGPDLQFRG